MRHSKSGRKLNRTAKHRKATLRNLAINLFQHKKIKTTAPKAKELRPFAEKLITKAINGSLADRRQAIKVLHDRTVINLLFDEIAPQINNKNGGYLRILGAGYRKGDGAEMAIIGFVQDFPTPDKQKSTKATTS